MKIDWDQIWTDQEIWYQEKRNSFVCPECGHVDFLDNPTWDEEKEKIEELVSAQLAQDE